ncbi:GlxA family transcriptional regulator [Solimicrobium silvestre]|uniref:Transcriptional regulator containing an amidase domain and an AraC-type DNA-binding HTH domain n=1 Tax=Solimicrobium silvestre TaxID=2099400 RepID=A0A2S9GSM7_9BURK|nr:GlxA family transcriptional regulator [Solimicrobium silvestre]PRC90724.1 Transcriptional regulator containing an amidase domain and an AraC-type DNA-binding HTH domain [Solimicrobium silvestre]
MITPLNIALLVFDGVQILDVTGPAAVFGAANDAVGYSFYRVHILSELGGKVKSNCAIEIDSSSLKKMSPRSIDTLLIAGGTEDKVCEFAALQTVRKWVLKASMSARRYGSICTGAFALGEFGLIDGKQVATHWSSCFDLQTAYPDANIDSNALYVEDGKLWTSAGVTTGIDMSLALVANDLGNEIADAIAKRLVLYARRPGYQSQFSPVLKAQIDAGAPFGKLITWMQEHLVETLTVSTLAERAMMSDRNFHRKFTSATGETPANFVETIRLDHARQLLTSGLSIKEIATKTGYLNATQLSKAFNRRFGISPSFFREMNSSVPISRTDGSN